MSAAVEAIARAWMAYQGYTTDEIDTDHGHTPECREDWVDTEMGRIPVCLDENGDSYHPIWDALDEACTIANVAIEALESIGLDVNRFEESLDEEDGSAQR